MKVIIAGGRNITDYAFVVSAIKESGFEITEVVSGGARGVDKLGERYAEENNLPLTTFEAYWKRHGKAAGPIRNTEMARYAEALIAIPEKCSPGTRNMIKKAIEKKLRVFIKEYT